MLKIIDVQKYKNTISVRFECDKQWCKYLINNEIVNVYDENIEEVPASIAIIPALCNLIPIAWVFDLDIECDELDECFNRAIPEILQGYKKSTRP